jgi:hypothetical protein
MCGASAEQNELSAEETQALQTSAQMTAQQYAGQQAIYAPLTAQYQSIFAKGPSQTGFSDAEKEGLDATAVEGTAENYSQAARAVGEQTAAEGGGTNPLPTGAQIQLKQEVANSAAQQESSEEEGIESADYVAGRSNFQAAGEGLQSIAAGENPLGFENAETGSAGVANSEANTIQQANDSWINAAIGAAGEIGGGFAEGYAKK